jgi:hypothetical protein
MSGTNTSPSPKVVPRAFQVVRHDMIERRVANEVGEEDASDSARRVTPNHPSHLGDDFVPTVPLGWAITVQPIDGREDLGTAGSPRASPAGDRKIKGWRRQSLVSEECGQLHHGVFTRGHPTRSRVGRWGGS